MSWLRISKSRLLGFFRKRRLDESLDAEVRAHLEMLAEENVRRGMLPEEARQIARREFGGVEQTRESYRDTQGLPMLEVFFQDLRYAVRTLGRNSGFAMVAVLTLALGIGANTAIFSIVNAVLLRPLPFPQADRIVAVYQTLPKLGVFRNGSSYLNFVDWSEQSHAFEKMGAFHESQFALTGIGDPESIPGATITPGLLSTLGVHPISGRLLIPADERPDASLVVVMSERLWRRRFGAAADLVGKTITLNKQAVTVAGILPGDFQYPFQVPAPELWVPVHQDPEMKDLVPRRGGHYLSVVALLKRDVTPNRAEAELVAIQARLAAQYPAENAGWSVRLAPLQGEIVGDVRLGLLVLLGAVALVLLIACANVANLLLARATSRSRELAIRAALGAGRKRVVRQLVTESLLLGGIGGALGAATAWWAVQSLAKLLPDDLPRVHTIQVDGWVLCFTLGLSIVVSLLFGLLPAFQATSGNLVESLKEGTRSATDRTQRRRMRGALIATEVALAVILTTGAGLLLRSFVELQRVSPGFRAKGVLTATVTLPQSQYTKPQEWARFYRQAVERISALPGVTGAAVVSPMPMSGGRINLAFEIDGRPQAPEDRISANYSSVSAEYFPVLGIPLLRGRAFDARDAAGSQNVTVVSEAFVRRYFPDGDPIGKHLIVGFEGRGSREIVGIVGDVKQMGLGVPAEPAMYVPYEQNPIWSMDFAVQNAGNPAALGPAVRAAIREADKDLLVENVEPLTDYLQMSVAQPRFRTFLLGIFGVVALLLAAVGIYGVIILRGGAAHAGDRRAHGVGSGARAGSGSRSPPRNEVGASWACRGCRDLGGAHKIFQQLVVRNYFYRSSYVWSCDSDSRRYFPIGVLHPSAASDARRSAGRLEVPVKLQVGGNWLRTSASRVAGLFSKRKREAELEEELRDHLDALTEERIRGGMRPEEARHAARREFGGVEQAKEAYREQRGLPFVETLIGDVRFAFRLLARKPGVTALMILTLALGIGVNTAIFSVVHSVLLQPLPYPQPDRLAIVWSVYGNEGRAPASGPELTLLHERSRLFEDFAGIWAQGGALTGKTEPEQVKLGLVTWNFLSLLSTKVQLGRFFAPEEQGAGAPSVIILSDGLWHRRYGADPSLIGRPVLLNGAPYTVVGVMPSDFRIVFPEGSSVPPDMDAYIPFPTNLATDPRDQGYIRVIGRLREGVTFAEFTEFSEQSLDLQIVPLHEDTVRNLRPALLALFAGVGFILLIACANVANLQLSLASERHREITLRAAIGAARGRVIRQLLTESILLACLSGAVAIGVGRWALQLLLSLRPVEMERLGTIELNLPALGFTLAVSIVAGIAFGLAPAIGASKINLVAALKEGGRSITGGKQRSRIILVACEVALGFVLLMGAGLMMRTFAALLRSDPGFEPKNVLTFRLSLASPKYQDPASAVHFLRVLQDNLSAIPGVEAAGLVSHLPFEDSLPNWYSYYWPEGAPKADQNTVTADYRSILPGHLRTMGVVFVAGRDFDQFDIVANRGVVVVDETVARKAWPNGDAVGKKLNIENGNFRRDALRESVEVVGVVRHVQYHSLTNQVRGQIYLLYPRAVRQHMAFAIKSKVDPRILAPAIRQEVAKLDKDLPVYSIVPMDVYVAKARRETRFTTLLAGVMAGIALLLACTGIYGVTSRAVFQRTTEMGVRMALGAQPQDVFRIVVRQSMAPVVLGVVVGLALSFLLTPLISGLLFGVHPTDLVTFLGTSLFLTAVGLLACYLPARRATRVDPIVALRYE